ncbi:MAG: ParA family partition ATPase [Candidatus Thiodiazotropha sp.]
MSVVALLGNKGGTGKTTLCVNLAAALNARGPAIVLDCDPQKSSLQWYNLADGSSEVPVIDAVSDLNARLKVAKQSHNYVLIDCPPSVHSTQTAQALKLADLALIPVQPSPFDLWASVHIEDEIAAAREHNPILHAYLVINQLEPRTRLSQIMDLALDELSLPTAKTAIRRRMIYRRAALEGRTVASTGSRGVAAAAEIEALIEEVIVS